MNEIEIELNEVSPQDFFGEQNKTIVQLRSYFPKLKIIARGSKIKAYGEEEVLEEFESVSTCSSPTLGNSMHLT